MVDPTTSNIGLAVPTRGSDPGTWDTPMNGNSSAIDGFIGGVQTISVSNANIVLTGPSATITPTAGPTQSQNAMVIFTGTLTGNVVVTLPLPGLITVYNLTTAAFTLSFAAALTGQVIAVEQGTIHRVVNDGTNCYLMDLPSVGAFLDLATTTVPAWIVACTKPPYLLCNGGTFSAVTYPYLNTVLGGTTLPDLRGVVRATLNQGTARITAAGSGIDGNTLLSVGGNQSLQQHSHTGAGVTATENQNHNHNYTGPSGNTTTGGGGFAAAGAITTLTTAVENQAHNHNFSFTTDATGGGASQNMPPTTIAGITLIRAA